MSLAAGTTLGPYEITALIGAGGMGEVYRARDRRLDRVVAVKVLPAALSARPDLRQRLEREARTVSSLNHPNICTLFDVGETGDGSTFLVMELLEGESLAERLARGPLPLRQALRYGAEIADALDRAHRQGIVHRDLKPANVMLTKSGVKLLDFGLAKVIQGADVLSDPNTPTVQQEKDVTAEGTIVGTLQYMSPEQLEGKVADGRSDIFALGATLYEMVTAQRAFVGGSRAVTIS
jgi:eukaryotic-like serine/threonine-protein kinase